MAVRYLKGPLRYLTDEGAVGLMIKLSRKADHGVASRAAVAQACLVPLSKEEDNQYLDSWVECLLDITAGVVPTAQIFGSMSDMPLSGSRQERLLRAPCPTKLVSICCLDTGRPTRGIFSDMPFGSLLLERTSVAGPGDGHQHETDAARRKRNRTSFGCIRCRVLVGMLFQVRLSAR